MSFCQLRNTLLTNTIIVKEIEAEIGIMLVLDIPASFAFI